MLKILSYALLCLLLCRRVLAKESNDLLHQDTVSLVKASGKQILIQYQEIINSKQYRKTKLLDGLITIISNLQTTPEDDSMIQEVKKAFSMEYFSPLKHRILAEKMPITFMITGLTPDSNHPRIGSNSGGMNNLLVFPDSNKSNFYAGSIILNSKNNQGYKLKIKTSATSGENFSMRSVSPLVAILNETYEVIEAKEYFSTFKSAHEYQFLLLGLDAVANYIILKYCKEHPTINFSNLSAKERDAVFNTTSKTLTAQEVNDTPRSKQRGIKRI
jgi:hypothetical protein